MSWALRLPWDQVLGLVSAPRREHRELAALWTSTGCSITCGRKNHEGRAGTGRAGGEPRDGAGAARPQRQAVVYLFRRLADGGRCLSAVAFNAAGAGRAWARQDRSVPLGIAAGQ